MIIDNPQQDYLWSLDSSTIAQEMNWNLRALIPEPDKAKMIRTGVWITPTPAVPGAGLKTQGLAYCGFRKNGMFINHVVGCWSTEVHRYGVEPLVIAGKVDNVELKEFAISTEEFYSRMENCVGGFTFRLDHPDWRQWCLPYWGAQDLLNPGAYHVQACLGMYQTSRSTISPIEEFVSNVDLGQKRGVVKIAQRVSSILPAGATIKMFWSENGGDYYEFYSRLGPFEGVDYPGIIFDEVRLVRYVGVKMSTPQGTTAYVGLNKLFCWG